MNHKSSMLLIALLLVIALSFHPIEKLVKQFNTSAEATEGQPWEKVNAAIGYALYAGDDTVEDVFRRADHIMYEQKKRMKAAHMSV